MRDFVEQCVSNTRRVAERLFRDSSDKDELVATAASVAWELAYDARPAATIRSITGYALDRVKSGRQFQQSKRSITHPIHRKRKSRMNMGELSRVGDDPALIVQAKIDFADFMASLSHQQQAVAWYFFFGYRTMEIAAELKLSPARISQIRTEIREEWEKLQGE